MSVRYIVLTLDDASAIADALHISALPERAQGNLLRIQERLRHETGADMQEIVDTLQKEEICYACKAEGVASSCAALTANQQGRRLRRLLERARGERGGPT